MSREDRARWDARYAALPVSSDWSPSPLLVDAVRQLSRRRGTLRGLAALDVACGAGRNSLMLAAAGFRVDGLDISAQGLALARRREQRLRPRGGLEPEVDGQRLPVRWIEADLEQKLPVSGPYDLIVMIRYLDLNLLEALCELLNADGLLVAELHMAADGSGHGPAAGPRNPNFLVQPGELAARCRSLHILLSREGLIDSGDGRQESLAQLVGTRLPDGSTGSAG